LQFFFITFKINKNYRKIHKFIIDVENLD